MDSFELNKIIGAVLGTLLFVMGAGFLAEAIYHPIENRAQGYLLPEPVEATAEADADAEPETPLGIMLANASVEAGMAAVRKCQSCHNFGEGEPHKTGPMLWDTVEHPIGGHAGYDYSDTFVELREAGETWTYENLNAFLISPRDFAPGTKMNFAGIRTAEERADIMAYLQTLSASPVPFPEPEAVEETATEAGDAPEASEGLEPVEVDGPAVEETPTTTQTETNVLGTPAEQGTPAGGTEVAPGAPGASVPAETEAAPAAAEEAPAEPAPAEAGPAEAAPAEAAPAEVDAAPAETPADTLRRRLPAAQ